MIDSAAFSVDGTGIEKGLLSVNGWRRRKNSNHRSPYSNIWSFNDNQLEAYYIYFPRINDYYDDKLFLKYASLSRIVHGNNVCIFKYEDIDTFLEIINLRMYQLGMIGIIDSIDLIFRSLDIPVNITMESHNQVRDVLNAFKNKYYYRSNFPRYVKKDSVYVRYRGKKISGNSGISIYDKKETAFRQGVDVSNILRIEMRFKNKQIIDRRLQKDLSLAEFYAVGDNVKTTFSNYLYNADITKDNKIKSYDGAKRMVSEEYIGKKKWPINLIKLISLRSTSKDVFPFTNKRQMKYYIDKVLRKRYGIDPVFTRKAIIDDLYGQVMDEIEQYMAC